MITDGAAVKWFLARDGEQHGPISAAEIAKLVELGHLKATDLVWRAGFSSWTPAGQLPELYSSTLPPPLPMPLGAVPIPYVADGGASASHHVATEVAPGAFSDEALLGIHLVVPRRMVGLIPYTHHGIYAGNGEVIHYAGYSNDSLKDGNKIQKTTLTRFRGDGDMTIRAHPSAKYSGKEVVERAQSRLNEDGYSLYGSNCEHFCNWAIDGDHRSDQVNTVTGIVVPGVSASTGGVGAGGVIGAGTAAGLAGGAGMMNSLAGAGAVVGGGAVAGIGVIGGSAGMAVAWLMNKYVLAESEWNSREENEALKAGRSGTILGVGAGTVGGVAAIGIAAAEGVAGAAAITSGLAGVGAVVGGGMAAGVALTVAAPAVAAVAAGYGVHKLAQRNETARNAINATSDAVVGTAQKGAELVGDAFSAVTPAPVKEAVSSATDIAKEKAGQIVREAGQAVQKAQELGSDLVKTASSSILGAAKSRLDGLFKDKGDPPQER